MKYWLKIVLVYTFLFLVYFLSMFVDITPWSTLLGFWLGIIYTLIVVQEKHNKTL